MKRRLPVAILSFLLLFSGKSFSQEKWAFSLNPSMGVQAYEREYTENNVVPIEEFGDFESPFYTSHLQYQIAASAQYSMFTFLKPMLSFGFSQFLNSAREEGGSNRTAPDGSRVKVERYGRYQVSDFSIMPAIQLDPLFKSENEALHFTMGLSLGLRKHYENYEVTIDTAESVYQQLTTTRKGFLVRAFAGLEWEEYFSDHFGYSIGIQYFLPYKFKPNSFTIEEYIKEYVPQTEAEGEYNYVDNQQADIDGKDLRRENFRMMDIYINVGLKYRL